MSTLEETQRLEALERLVQDISRERLPRYLTRGFVSDEPPSAGQVYQWNDTNKKFRPVSLSGAMKTQNSGYFTIPAMPSIGTSVAKSASANTWGSWVEMIASTSAALYIVGARLYSNTTTVTNTYLALDIGTGAGGAETSIGYIPFSGEDPGTDSGLFGLTYTFPDKIPVATATRIACRTAGSSTSAENVRIALICVNQADLVSL